MPDHTQRTRFLGRSCAPPIPRLERRPPWVLVDNPGTRYMYSPRPHDLLPPPTVHTLDVVAVLEAGYTRDQALAALARAARERPELGQLRVAEWGVPPVVGTHVVARFVWSRSSTVTDTLAGAGVDLDEAHRLEAEIRTEARDAAMCRMVAAVDTARAAMAARMGKAAS